MLGLDKQRGQIKIAFGQIGPVRQVMMGRHPRSFIGADAYVFMNPPELGGVDQRPHFGGFIARCADPHIGECRAQRLDKGIGDRILNDQPRAGGANLVSIAGAVYFRDLAGVFDIRIVEGS